MTYFKLNADLPDADKSIGDLTAPSSIAANQRMPCGSITHTGLTVNASGQLVLSANTTFIIFGSPLIEANSSPYNGTIVFQWYDVTNSSWIGRPLYNWVNTSNSTTNDRSSIARAVIYPTASTTIEFRIKSIGTTGIDTINPASPSAHWGTHAPYVGTQYYSVLSF